jgi:hypothetical protein
MGRTNRTPSGKYLGSEAEGTIQTERGVHERNEGGPKDLFDESNDDLADSPFYSMDRAFTAKYHETAHILAKIHRYQEFFYGLFCEYQDPENQDQISAVGRALEFLQRCSADPFVLDLAQFLGTGDYKNVARIARIFEDYERGFPRLRGEEAKAKLFAMVACESLRETSYERRHISKAHIRWLAEHMRAIRSLRSQKRIKNSTKTRRAFGVEPELIEREIEVLKLQKSAWTRIWKDLGLSDIRQGRAGRPSGEEEHWVLWW